MADVSCKYSIGPRAENFATALPMPHSLTVPLFSRQMFENLGPGWASSILGFVSLVAIPVPIIISRCAALVGLFGISIKKDTHARADPLFLLPFLSLSPPLLFSYGPRIRQHSKMATSF